MLVGTSMREKLALQVILEAVIEGKAAFGVQYVVLTMGHLSG